MAIAAAVLGVFSREPYIVGKPNSMMFRSALNKFGVHPASSLASRQDYIQCLSLVASPTEQKLHAILSGRSL